MYACLVFSVAERAYIKANRCEYVCLQRPTGACMCVFAVAAEQAYGKGEKMRVCVSLLFVCVFLRH